MRTVFLDRDSLSVSFRPPRCASPYVEHGQTSTEEAVRRLSGATIAIVNKVDLSAAELVQLPDLRLIAIVGTGYDCVDVNYCRGHGISVANVRDYAMYSVSEHVFALLLALRRNLAGYAALIAGGEWQL